MKGCDVMVIPVDFAYPIGQAPVHLSNLGTKPPQDGDTIEGYRCHEAIKIESMECRGLALVV